MLRDKISNVRGAVIMAYPMGLPEYDLVRRSLDDESLEVSLACCVLLCCVRVGIGYSNTLLEK
jgi:hypothetical protein